ncbi:hypothetical protein [Kitasatospora sp. NPDC056531]|uniref:hypothetical protein n=1 Tax=Kitasatospora sp. NPDC056531 TaxID=3345856 RepID=UPI0036752970
MVDSGPACALGHLVPHGTSPPALLGVAAPAAVLANVSIADLVLLSWRYRRCADHAEAIARHAGLFAQAATAEP